ncbi:hypothetical protein H257_14741 [Aphanomyces astaci]|uniref:CCHC-type domain-containing protein n=1 Tax=Aphanomyces astaci TaxID=112090 RepID=W4FQ52_APHAT|nr:hypothetical protein H257_14741 [Aphanomyces astaci]ETV69602.1 hypothetical protein H257_14741 [Aphanomyces astaci]|eukprot:XP_009840929.1 hypothetical protein H257_14741 [Aphanomyces astaci]
MVVPSKILRIAHDEIARLTRPLESETPSASRLKSIKLDVAKFGGAESDILLRWLLQVSTAADAQRIPDDATRVAFAMSHLKGHAEDWAFSKRLTDRHCFASFTYLAYKQGKHSLQEFIHDLRFFAANINDEESLPEPLWVTVFMDGLNQGPARTQLFRAYPDTFEAAVRIALSESFSSSFAHARAASSDMDVSMLTQPSDDRTCFNCGHPGHFSRACPAPRRVASAAPTSHGSSRAAPARYPLASPLRAVHLTASIANAMAPHAHLSSPLQARVRREMVCGALKHSQDLASDTDLLLCSVGLQLNKMIRLELVVTVFPARLSVLIDCGAWNNYASRSTLYRFNGLPSSDPSDRVRVKMADGHTASQPRIIVDVPITFDGFDSVEPFNAKSVHKVTWLNASQPWIHRRAADRLPPSTTNPLGPPLEAMSNDLASPNPAARLLAPVPASPTDPATAPLSPPIAASTLAATFIEETCNLNELPWTSSEILALPEMSFHSLVESLRAHDIAALAMITVEEETDLFSTSTADYSALAAPLKSQTWDSLRSSPYYDLLKEFEDVFPDDVPCRLPIDKGVQHEIDLVSGAKYCVTRQWPLPRDQVDAMDAFFAARKAAGHVRESISPHSSPTFCVKKPGGKWRIVHAFNKLNAATIPAQTPIPLKDVIIDGMGRSTIFSTIDLRDGFCQILMHLWSLQRPATFNRMVTAKFLGFRDFAPSYFDDIYVFEVLRANGLYANLAKCMFGVDKIPVLGDLVGDLRRLLGLATYLHKYSQNFADIAQLVFRLLLKDAPWLDASGRPRPVSYQSRQLHAAERAYPALTKFRIYLLGGKPFVVYTEHASLRTATNTPHLSQRMARWISFFTEFTFSVQYKPGKDNILADALSRCPDLELTTIGLLTSGFHDRVSSLTLTARRAWRRSPTPFPPTFPPNPAALRRPYTSRWNFDVPTHRGLAPAQLSCPATRSCASLSFGRTTTAPVAAILTATKCTRSWRRTKITTSSRAPFQPLPIPNELWSSVSMDLMFVQPRDARSNTGIMVCVDRASKYVVALPVRDMLNGADAAPSSKPIRSTRRSQVAPKTRLASTAPLALAPPPTSSLDPEEVSALAPPIAHASAIVGSWDRDGQRRVGCSLCEFAPHIYAGGDPCDRPSVQMPMLLSPHPGEIGQRIDYCQRQLHMPPAALSDKRPHKRYKPHSTRNAATCTVATANWTATRITTHHDTTTNKPELFPSK